MVKWRGRRQSGNIEDVRGQGYSGGGGMAMMLIPLVLRIFGWRGLIILAFGAAIVWFVVGDLGSLTGGGERVVEQQVPAGQEEAAQFAAVILADTEDVWTAVFAERGADYPEPTLTLYSDSWPSACGVGQAAMGPFYCPGDRKIYLDLTFFDRLSGPLGAEGDFAPAYVIAHEVGHHVQNLLGVLTQAQRMKQGLTRSDRNAVQVQVELMADCLAGVWAARADQRFDILEAGDISEAMGAAEAVGDDTLQRRSQGRVVPDSFTHGSAAQRQDWFMRGYDSGLMETCDTLDGAQP